MTWFTACVLHHTFNKAQMKSRSAPSDQMVVPAKGSFVLPSYTACPKRPKE